MKVRGQLQKDGSYYVVDVPALGGAITQGYRTKKDAYAMLVEWIELMTESHFDEPLKVEVIPVDKVSFEITAADAKKLFALVLRQQRQLGHLTVKDVAQKLGYKSPNAYAQYEQAQRDPSLSTMQSLLAAVMPGHSFVLF